MGTIVQFCKQRLIDGKSLIESQPCDNSGNASDAATSSQIDYQNFGDTCRGDKFFQDAPRLATSGVFAKNNLLPITIGTSKDIPAIIRVIKDQPPGICFAAEQYFVRNDGTRPPEAHVVAIVPDHDGTIKVMDPNYGLFSIGRDNRNLEDFICMGADRARQGDVHSVVIKLHHIRVATPDEIQLVEDKIEVFAAAKSNVEEIR